MTSCVLRCHLSSDPSVMLRFCRYDNTPSFCGTRTSRQLRRSSIQLSRFVIFVSKNASVCGFKGVFFNISCAAGVGLGC